MVTGEKLRRLREKLKRKTWPLPWTGKMKASSLLSGGLKFVELTFCLTDNNQKYTETCYNVYFYTSFFSLLNLRTALAISQVHRYDSLF